MKGHVRERQREWRKLGHDIVEQSTGANVEGWAKLANFFASGGGTIQHGGERLVS